MGIQATAALDTAMEALIKQLELLKRTKGEGHSEAYKAGYDNAIDEAIELTKEIVSDY
jgi:hypothetical protein